MTELRPRLEVLADSLPGAQVGVSIRDGSICLNGEAVFRIPEGSKNWMRHEAPSVWPNTPHGEPRPTLLFGIVKDAGMAGGKPSLDGELLTALSNRVGGDTTEQRDALATAMAAKFWTGAESRVRRSAHDRRRYLVPLHASLPLGFDQERAAGGKTAFGYKMFRGTVLPFLLSHPDGTCDTQLLEDFLAVFTSEADLTRLDKMVLEIAEDLAPNVAGPDVNILLDRSADVLSSLREAGGGFCQPSMDRFGCDLREVLSLDLPRRDLINQLTNLLALHLSIRLYRAGMVLSQRLDRCIGLYSGHTEHLSSACASGCIGDTSRCSLAGQFHFRVGSGAFRPVKLTEPCVTSYRYMTSRFLLPLPVTITATNFAIDLLKYVGGPTLRSMDLVGLCAALGADDDLRTRFDAAMHLLAIARRYELRGASVDLARLAQQDVPGLHAFREALLEGRRKSMRHESRDVVHQLAKNVRSGRLMMGNGPAVTFFELDEDMLHLLVRLLCGKRLVPYRDFLTGLLNYGLAPQDSAESERLQSALERLGMLQRYSDASESAYVHHTEAIILGEDF
jgi:hypothetical protein